MKIHDLIVSKHNAREHLTLQIFIKSAHVYLWVSKDSVIELEHGVIRIENNDGVINAMIRDGDNCSFDSEAHALIIK